MIESRHKRIASFGLHATVSYESTQQGTFRGIALTPRSAFTHLQTRRDRKRFYAQDKKYHITIGVPLAWPALYQTHGLNAFTRAWKRQVRIRELTRQGTTRIRIADVNRHSSLANVMSDDDLRLPLGLIGAQQVTAGEHPYMGSISM